MQMFVSESEGNVSYNLSWMMLERTVVVFNRVRECVERTNAKPLKNLMSRVVTILLTVTPQTIAKNGSPKANRKTIINERVNCILDCGVRPPSADRRAQQQDKNCRYHDSRFSKHPHTYSIARLVTVQIVQCLSLKLPNGLVTPLV
jgi:hypothetical protein